MNVTFQEHLVRIMVVSVPDRLDAYNSLALRERLDQLCGDGVTNYVVDLSHTPFLDSAGMAVLVSLLKKARLASGDVKLVWPKHEAAIRILRLTKFDRVFDMADSADLAIKGF